MSDHQITAECDASAVWTMYYDARKEQIDTDVDVRAGGHRPPYRCSCGETFDSETEAYQHLRSTMESEREPR